MRIEIMVNVDASHVPSNELEDYGENLRERFLDFALSLGLRDPHVDTEEVEELKDGG